MFVFGASGHGKVVFEIAEVLGYEVEVFVDDNDALHKLWDVPIVTEVPSQLSKGVLAVGNNEIRKKLAIRFSNKKFLTLVHPKANISNRTSLGNGTVVMAGATINANVNIGAHVIINTNASVDHDCNIEDFVHISPNVALSGGVRIGEGTHIGIGACVIPGINIGKWATIGAGAVIIKDVPEGATVVGNPGRVL